MAELTRRLRAVQEEIALAERQMTGDGAHKVAGWRLAVEDALAVFDSGRLRAVTEEQTRGHRSIAIKVMQARSQELRWGLSPDEWIEFVDSGGLYGSVLDSVLEAWEHAGYEVVRGIG